MQTQLARLLVLGVLSQAFSTVQAQIPAFSGAEGPGASATGGRGGDVYHVTNLEADKDGVIPGSLSYGIDNAPSAGRTIVFDVGGTIYLEGTSSGNRLRYGKSNITIAGQTAPGPGITIAGTGSKWTGDNNILRNITIRPNQVSNGTTHDAFDLQLKNSIVDHVSSSWYTDEGISITDAGRNSTVQYSTIGEGLAYAGHAFGSIIATEVDGTHYSFNHNLYAHNNSRMPAIGSETGQTGAVLSFTNNVIYNWRRTKAGYSATDQHSSSNFLANFYITGPDKGNLTFTGGDDEDSVGFTQIFLDKTDPVTANLGDMNQDGDTDDGLPFTQGDSIPNTPGNKYYSGDFTVPATAFVVNGAVTPDTADVALQRVLDYGGANWNNRNPIEQRILDSVSTGTGGIISDTTSGQQATEWATVLSQRPTGGVAPFSHAVNWDTDQDGMPDYWEEEHGLNPNVANNNGDFDSDGYTDVEEYINEIAAWPAPAPIVFTAGTARYAEIQNWLVDTQPVTSIGAQNAFSDFHWQPSKYDTAVINDGTVIVDAAGQHAGNLVLAMNPGDNVAFNITSGWLKVEEASHGLSDGITVIGDDPAATAVLNLSGGKLTTKTLLKGAGGTFNFTGGSLSAEEVYFDLVNNGGTITPGNSAGRTEVFGNLTVNSGILDIELGGTIGGTEFDALSVTGDVMLGGTLDVSLIESFTLSPEQTFEILDVGGTLTGQFAGLAEGALVGNFGEDLYITYQGGDGNDVELFTLTPFLPEDLNMDGFVDSLDLGILLSNWNQSTTPDMGELNGTPPVEGLDLGILLAAWNPPPVAAATVPEPCGIAFIGIALSMSYFKRRRG